MRRLTGIVLILVALVILGVAACPWWLGGALARFGADRGLSFARYERLGYSRFALHEVEFRKGAVRVMADRAEGPTPVIWLWRHWRDVPVEATAGAWRVEAQGRGKADPSRERGWVPLRARLARIVDRLDDWLPRATVGPGVVRWPAGELTLAAATWDDRTLAVKDLGFRGRVAQLNASWTKEDDRLRASLQSGGELALVLESRGAGISGELTWLDQRAPIEATFAPQGWLPAAASAAARGWEVPPAQLKLAGHYATVRGDGRLEWHGADFVVEVAAAGDPRAEGAAPPLEVNLRARGTLEAVTIEALQAVVPGLQAELSAPVVVERSGRLRGGGARFTFESDLAQQPWFEAQGAATGEAVVTSADGASPKASFSFTARDILAQGVALPRVNLAGELDWPRIQLTDATISGGEGERLTARGSWDFKAKELVDVVVAGRIHRSSVARWLPEQPGFEAIELAAQARGPWPEFEHQGEARIGELTVEGMKPLSARLEWRGQGPSAEQFQVLVQAQQSALRIGGMLDRNRVEVRELALGRGDATLLELTEPAGFRWKPALQVESLHLAGADSGLDATLTWGPSGRIELAARSIPSEWLEDFVAAKGPDWKLNLLAFSGSWDHGPVTFALTLGAEIDLGDGRKAALNAAGRGDEAGIEIEALRAAEGGTTVFNATGRVPATFHPGSSRLLRIDSRGPIALDASAVPHAGFWSKLAEATGVGLQEPQAVVRVAGSWERPEGEISLKATRIVMDPGRVKRPLPEIGDLDVQLSAKRSTIDLNTFALEVEGQPVRAHGQLPVPEGGWARLLREPLTALRRNASLELEVPEAEVSVFARFLPAMLAPQGRIQAALTYKQGQLGGQFQLRDAASRPLGPLGVLQEINADVGLEGRTLNLHSVRARSGGQPVSLTGKVEVPESGEPRFDLVLAGKNLPFVRQAGLLLRGDLNLKLQSPPQPGPPRITGNVRLRDSLFLQDVRAFLPRGGGGPTKRPPYFSVETPPLDAWNLAVDVSGEEFMRLRTPVFNGVASAHFRLGGTLGDPRAIGEVTIDEGVIRMPFASFEVTQGAVRLTEANAVEPVIYLRGAARRFGYDLSVEIEGKASAPNMEFRSSPALDSEEVLLMVMTGAVPSEEVTYSGTERVARIGAFLGQSILSSLGADSGSADRLSIASGEKISRQGKETYEIEYKLSDRWTAIGEYNEFDEYNAGLKWRIYPRQKDPGRDDSAPEEGTDAPR